MRRKTQRLNVTDLNKLNSIIVDSSSGNLTNFAFRVMMNLGKYYIKLKEDAVAFKVLDYIINKSKNDTLIQNALFLKIKFGSENIEEDFFRGRCGNFL